MQATDAAEASFGLSTIGQIALAVSQLDRAVAFYRDALGMRQLFQVPKMSFFDLNGLRLMIGEGESPGAGHSSVLYFRVGDIHEAARALEGRGVAFERAPHLVARMPDHDLWMAFFRDPDHNPLALMSEVRPGHP
ncbi:MAG: VOC family protein [Bryobacteraceae bacterium]|jgi:methylmalonyl-CoA/ethylmalonyl-CoA epimerase